jgi:PAS domain S-box-containing protein
MHNSVNTDPENGLSTPRWPGAEETLRKQARLIDLAPVAAIVRDLDGTIKFWSQGAETLYGWTETEALGRRTHELFQTEFPEPLPEIISTLVEGKKWKGELRHRTRDGRRIIVESHWLAEFDAVGNVIELLETNTDITDSKKLREHLEEMVEERTTELQGSNEALEAFSYTLSHDLRAPLRAIAAYAELAVEDSRGELSRSAQDYLGKITGLARRADRFIQNVLALSCVSKQRVEIKPVDLGKVVGELIHDRPELQEPLADLRVEGDRAIVLGEETLLTQVVTNLLGNAVKFVARGTKPKVRVRTETLGARVRLWVEDNGIGIEPLAQKRIFELFGRNQAIENYEGTGIGLTIVRKAVERMNGSVGVESVPGQGSRFWVDLPRGHGVSQPSRVAHLPIPALRSQK